LNHEHGGGKKERGKCLHNHAGKRGGAREKEGALILHFFTICNRKEMERGGKKRRKEEISSTPF